MKFPLTVSVVTPPHAVGFANGVAQSIVSLARCFGPVLGGYVSTNSALWWYDDILTHNVALGGWHQRRSVGISSRIRGMFGRMCARRCTQLFHSLIRRRGPCCLEFPARYSTHHTVCLHMIIYSNRFNGRYMGCWFVWLTTSHEQPVELYCTVYYVGTHSTPSSESNSHNTHSTS
jgi:hypothetical protein